jgi:hypothetical protein
MKFKVLIANLYIASFLLFSSKPTLADVILPVDQILREIDPKVRMPIMLPDKLPRMDQVFPSVSVSSHGKVGGDLYYDNDYFIEFKISPNCEELQGCRLATFSATLDGIFFFATDGAVSGMAFQVGERQVQLLEVKRIELVDEHGDRIDDVRFTKQCGLPVAPCGSDEMVTLEWRYGGVMYEVS